LPQWLPRAEVLLSHIAQVRQSTGALTVRELAIPLGVAGGDEVVVDCELTPVGDSPGAEPEVLLELSPLERHLRISREEALLTQHEATRAVARGLAHEIRNPLGGLRGAAQLLEKELQGAQFAEYTQIIIKEADRLRDLVDALLGPREACRASVLNVHEPLEHVARLVEVEAPSALTLVRDYDPSIPELSADRDRLVQALLNLVANARQAMSDRGRLVLRSRIVRNYTVANRLHRLAVRLDVEDDGPGVPAALRERIFYPLVSGVTGGTGLGLALAQELVQRQGGVIEFESVPGATVFSIILPTGEGR
jgi:two-component system nitrogen regulation sensor histidine kinase GlnL